MNTHLSTIGQNLAKEIPSSDVSQMHYLTNVYPDSNPSNTTPDEITSIVKSLNVIAPGIGEIHSKGIKITIPLLDNIVSKSD